MVRHSQTSGFVERSYRTILYDLLRKHVSRTLSRADQHREMSIICGHDRLQFMQAYPAQGQLCGVRSHLCLGKHYGSYCGEQ